MLLLRKYSKNMIFLSQNYFLKNSFYDVQLNHEKKSEIGISLEFQYKNKIIFHR